MVSFLPSRYFLRLCIVFHYKKIFFCVNHARASFGYNRGMTIAVIGAGASGMAAALQAAWKGAAVTLFERNQAVGRKLLVTGSGRCNISNAAAAAPAYTCADPRWMETLLKRFGVDDLLAMLAELGVPVCKTSDGWYYPLSEAAAAVVGRLFPARWNWRLWRWFLPPASVRSAPTGMILW